MRCSFRVDVLTQLAHVVDAAVGSGVDLDHVQIAPFYHCDAVIALIVWLAVVGIRAVEGFGEDARRRGFAGAARACKQVGMGYAVFGDRSAQGLCDVVLADEFGELL